MAIIAGVNLPDGKRMEIALSRLYGVGRTNAQAIARKLGIEGNPKMRELREEQLARIREVLDREYRVEGALRQTVQRDIRRKIEIGCYQGHRHRLGLPVRGQRTRTNARSRKGLRKTVAGRRRTAAKK
ncbi:MAG: 30S ribosomal protein S13 [Chloroflexi bacterium]|nr:30S ribosomal protein S13 [Chloroflexota bacterium]